MKRMKCPTVLALAALLLSGCAWWMEHAGPPPKRDECRDCPPGIFSGEDGYIVILGGEEEGEDKDR